MTPIPSAFRVPRSTFPQHPLIWRRVAMLAEIRQRRAARVREWRAAFAWAANVLLTLLAAFAAAAALGFVVTGGLTRLGLALAERLLSP